MVSGIWWDRHHLKKQVAFSGHQVIWGKVGQYRLKGIFLHRWVVPLSWLLFWNIYLLISTCHLSTSHLGSWSPCLKPISFQMWRSPISLLPKTLIMSINSLNILNSAEFWSCQPLSLASQPCSPLEVSLSTPWEIFPTPTPHFPQPEPLETTIQLSLWVQLL